MKKIILRSSYFVYLLCFNILVSSLLFWLGESVLGNLKIGGDAYFGISYLVLALLNIFLSYFYAKARIEKKILIILTIAGVVVKILLFLLWAQEGFSEVGDDKMGIFMVAIVYGYFAYIGSLDIIFLVGTGVNLLIRRKNEREKLDS
ncbi:flagellar biosynthesis protein FliQ [Leptotrichia massiliensis]|uniref:flagellar biosynthesis protein FliQ n=1 Tax=Leptotrichia massiliensis TaxID=1852388 RepID=UPI0028D176B9|nr:flagellar biosynthesis protein FliQ [Leptotrichia massiliensis]